MPDDDRIEEIFRGALRRKAEGAPPEHGLASRVRARLARRRRRQVAGATVACVAVVAGFVGVAQSGDPTGRDGSDVAEPDRSDEPAVDGWRWESYGGVEVQVPETWGYGTTGTPPCLDVQPAVPYVGRPGFVETIGCTQPLPELGRRVPYLWFDTAEAPGVQTYDAGWATETRNVHYMRITVLTDDADLRQRILDSIRVREHGDSYGCAAEDRVIEGPDVRPIPVDGGLETVGDVESISICRYTVSGGVMDPSHGPLLSSSELTGPAARDLVRDLLAAPEGSGPNDPEHCTRAAAYGDEIILLQVRGSAHDQAAYVRYAGCDGHGTDDGVTPHQLTRPVMRALLTGPHRPSTLQGSVADLAGWR